MFNSKGLVIFGPTQQAAELEASKVFTKNLLKKYSIPSGDYNVFESSADALSYIKEETGVPIVLKADGLAAGKGVILAKTISEAEEAVNLILNKKAFGDAGKRLIVEEFLTGEEASFMAITDGKTVLPLATSQDHKPIFDNDKGPNTGGMGAYSPAPVVDDAMFDMVMKNIMEPTVKAMEAEGRPYKGVLYAGLMIKEGKPKVLEFNCRFGDPEAQPILMRLENDLYEVLEATVKGKLQDIKLQWDRRPSVCVVLSSKGYPGKYEKGKVINGLEDASKLEDTMVFHAGTARRENQFVTSGGRVLGVTALGENITDAIEKAYQCVSHISWDGMYYRTDIGKKALKHLNISKNPMVGILMGSMSDMEVMTAAQKVLDGFGVSSEIKVLSAHRSPELAMDYAKNAKGRGIQVIIAGAGMAAHLAGSIAAHSNLPVIGVPINSSPLNGLDALLSTVQMPPGVPVATVSIGKPGAKNAAILALQIIALKDKEIEKKLAAFRKKQVEDIKEINEKYNEA
jgi:phosphoribosylamine--glycine ligase